MEDVKDIIYLELLNNLFFENGLITEEIKEQIQIDINNLAVEQPKITA